MVGSRLEDRELVLMKRESCFAAGFMIERGERIFSRLFPSIEKKELVLRLVCGSKRDIAGLAAVRDSLRVKVRCVACFLGSKRKRLIWFCGLFVGKTREGWLLDWKKRKDVVLWLDLRLEKRESWLCGLLLGSKRKRADFVHVCWLQKRGTGFDRCLLARKQTELVSGHASVNTSYRIIASSNISPGST